MPPRYCIPDVLNGLTVLEILQSESRPFKPEEIWSLTHISKATVFRILQTLINRGYVHRIQPDEYQAVVARPKMFVGFASQSEEMPFPQTVTKSIKAAALSAGVDLLVLDNRYDPQIAIHNAERFISAGVDLVIEFQINTQVAPIIADKINSSGIPLIALGIPHPHATFFGFNNYRVGFEAGQYIAKHAKHKWPGRVPWVIGLDIEQAGPLVQSRITGAFHGVQSVLPGLPESAFLRLDGKGMRGPSYLLISDFLRSYPRNCVMIVAATDSSALGALDAVRIFKREPDVAIVSHDAIPEAIEEIARPESPFLASITSDVSRHGPRLLQLGSALLEGRPKPPYNFVDHHLIAAQPISPH
jgi:ribose transport system substrate-binding protein